jgi:predicted  nucleic acid-binding Zn-ribbon protein
MSTVTKSEMDEKLSNVINFVMSFMDDTNNKIKLMEEEIKQHKDKITSLEKELNEGYNTINKTMVTDYNTIIDYTNVIHEKISTERNTINKDLDEHDEKICTIHNTFIGYFKEHYEQIGSIIEVVKKLEEKINENYNTLHDYATNIHETMLTI